LSCGKECKKKFKIDRWTANKLSYVSSIYRIIILPVVLYGCETWTLTLREERRLRVFENRVYRRIFGYKRYEITSERRKLHNEEVNDRHYSPNILRMIKSRKMGWAEHLARMVRGEACAGFWWENLKATGETQA
jgi:hypothetical protein